MRQTNGKSQVQEDRDVRERDTQVIEEDKIGSVQKQGSQRGAQTQSFGKPDPDQPSPQTDTYDDPGENAAANEPESCGCEGDHGR
ncbi:MAG: hypothetical protein JWN70_3130 [Planctomycetaceae bacterium]|nr:hypothetical protein [Planctomycetaceae bacterium]